MLHIKLKGMTNAATYKHIVCPYIHPRPFGSKGQNICFFLKEVMLHIKFKGIEHKIPWKQFFCPYSHPRPLEWGQKVKTFFSESSYVAYQIKGNGAYSSMQVHSLSLHTPSAPWVGL